MDIRIPGFGNSETVEWLDPSHAATGSYFIDIGNTLVKMGYTRNVSIKGAPYDFRKGPSKPYQPNKFGVMTKDVFVLQMKTKIIL